MLLATFCSSKSRFPYKSNEKSMFWSSERLPQPRPQEPGGGGRQLQGGGHHHQEGPDGLLHRGAAAGPGAALTVI